MRSVASVVKFCQFSTAFRAFPIEDRYDRSRKEAEMAYAIRKVVAVLAVVAVFAAIALA